MRIDRDRCHFCGTAIFKSGPQKNATVEHVVPRWLQKHLAIENVEVQLTLTSLASRKIVGQRNQHQLANLILGSVCENCNKGWMKGLEDAVARFLGVLADGAKPLATLTSNELHLLALWSAKTAYGFSAVGLEPHVPQAHFHTLAKGSQLPPRVVVFARQQSASDGKFALCINRDWRGHAQLEREAARRVRRTSYRIGMLLGELTLVVVFWPLIGWAYRAERDFLMLVYPPTADITRYDHPVPTWSTGAIDLCNRATLVTTVSWRPDATGIAGNRQRHKVFSP